MDSRFKRYLFEYRHDGAEWGVEIFATSQEDAQARLKKLPWASLKGEVVAKVQVPGGSLLRKLSHLFGQD